ncbi:MAG: discoidin domain-containing protein [Thermodesulfobacteriota bacterium]
MNKAGKEQYSDTVDLTSNAGSPQAKPRSALTRCLMGLGYVVFLIAVVGGTLGALEYYAYRKIKNSPLGEPYKDKNLRLALHSSQKTAPAYGYEPTPGCASVRNTRLGNSFEYINEQSFKDFEDVPIEKPEDEFRVFITGGSVVYGRGPVPPTDKLVDFYEVTYRWTIPHIMEQLLNKDPRVREKIAGKKVRVINAGVPGYVYQNNLMRYLAKLRLYKPDLLVALDGVNDNHTVARVRKDWNYFNEGPYYQVIVDVMDMEGRGLLNYLALWLKRNTYFFTLMALQRGEGTGIFNENEGIASIAHDPTPEMITYRANNIRQVADVVAIFHKTLEADGIPHVFALQPLFRTSKKKRTPLEARIENETGMFKVGFFDAKETYDLFRKTVRERCGATGFDVVDLNGLYDDVTDWVFTDWCHLTNGANYLMAKALTNLVKERVWGLPLSEEDRITIPVDTYLKDYSKLAKVLVAEKPSDAGLHILKGYPSPELLEVASNPGSPQPVVLDLGSVVPVSRLRIVWADEKAVPASWAVEVSEDGKKWEKWLEVPKTVTDKYDQWPGFEYYSPTSLRARFARYSPTGESSKSPIQLRQLSLFR